MTIKSIPSTVKNRTGQYRRYLLPPPRSALFPVRDIPVPYVPSSRRPGKVSGYKKTGGRGKFQEKINRS